MDPQNPPPKGVYFEIKEKERTCHLTDEGVREAEELAGVESFYTAGNMEWPHLIDNALKAHHLYHKDRHYMIDARPAREQRARHHHRRRVHRPRHVRPAVVRRAAPGGRGQAPKEGVQIKQETQTLATITLQNFFKLYKKLARHDRHRHDRGQRVLEDLQARRRRHPDQQAAASASTTRTSSTAPTRRSGTRSSTRSWRSHKTGRPILVGTTDVDKSEKLSRHAQAPRHQARTAQRQAENVAREAEIVAQAGRIGAVTIATNMAGRGTDIILGGNPETLAWARLKQLKDADGRPLYPTRLEVPNDVWTTTVDEIEAKEKMKEEGRKVAEMGGLHIVGTERHEARRIDNQLRGRAGRQGDPGSQPLLPLAGRRPDAHVRRRVGRRTSSRGWAWRKARRSRAGMVSRRIEKAQKKVEEYNFDQRKNLLEYDEVMDHQRKRVYGSRQEILDGKNPRAMILDMIDEQIDDGRRPVPRRRLRRRQLRRVRQQPARRRVRRRRLPRRRLRRRIATALDKAIANVPTFIQEPIEENLNPDEDPKDWKWSELTRAVNARYGLKLTEKELKKISPRS